MHMGMHSPVLQELRDGALDSRIPVCLCGTGIHSLLTYGKLTRLALTPYGCFDGLRRCSMQRLGTEPGMQGALHKWQL